MDETSLSDDDEERFLTLNDEPSDNEEEDQESEELNEADDNPEEQFRYSVSKPASQISMCQSAINLCQHRM
jgi:hypothetical protein